MPLKNTTAHARPWAETYVVNRRGTGYLYWRIVWRDVTSAAKAVEQSTVKLYVGPAGDNSRRPIAARVVHLTAELLAPFAATGTLPDKPALRAALGHAAAIVEADQARIDAGNTDDGREAVQALFDDALAHTRATAQAAKAARDAEQAQQTVEQTAA